MIAKELVLKIVMMCLYDINPNFDKEMCVKHMIECVDEAEFSACSEYWEPLARRDHESPDQP
jgi:hypothetical protein